MRIDSAQPFYGANGLPAGGIDVEAVYGGLGSEADFSGKDVTGKAVFVFNQTGLKDEGAVRRADVKARRHRRSPLEATTVMPRAISSRPCRPARPRASRHASRCSACRT